MNRTTPSRETGSARAERDRATVDNLRAAASARGLDRQRLLDAAVELNMPMAYRLATRYFRRGMAEDDLNQVACLALVKAVQRFDPAKGDLFAPFAILTIRGELRRHFRDSGWTVRPPRKVQELRARVRDTESALAQQLNRPPTVQELADAVGAEAVEVREATNLSSCFEPVSIDGTVAPRSDQTLAERLGVTDLDFDAVEARVMLAPLLAELSERERRIIALRFVEQLTQQEIGDRLGTSQMQVSRLLSGVYAHLREALGEAAPSAA